MAGNLLWKIKILKVRLISSLKKKDLISISSMKKVSLKTKSLMSKVTLFMDLTKMELSI